MQRALNIILTLGFIIFSLSTLMAQPSVDKDRRVIQLSGQIKHTDHQTPIQGVSIIVKNKNRGTYSDFRGIYSIAIQEMDTLVLSSIGFKTQHIIIPEHKEMSNFKYLEIIMHQDTVYLNPISIQSLPEGRAFDYAFTQIDDDSPSKALRKNLNPQSIVEMTRTMPYQNTEIQFRTQKMMNDERGWDGMRKTGPLLKVNGLSDLFKKSKD